MSDECQDCPTCKWTRHANCSAPDYIDMDYTEKAAFWREETPCRLWEADDEQ